MLQITPQFKSINVFPLSFLTALTDLSHSSVALLSSTLTVTKKICYDLSQSTNVYFPEQGFKQVT